MPSGYTHDIYDGKEVTGVEFILKCSRAFGAAVMMREEPLSNPIREIEVSDYHIKSMERASRDLENILALSTDEIIATIEENYQQRLEDIQQTLEAKNKLRASYEKVLREVEAWVPPTDEHSRLKEYAIEQLESSIDFDCDTSHLYPPTKESPDEWMAGCIQYYEGEVAYHTKQYEEEVQRVAKQNKWVRDLYDSLRKDAES